ncbi:MAG: hypothetical protein IKC74_05950 [Clostridia bacterium]|nr:hypothetical protein [Clostridia bacterium]
METKSKAKKIMHIFNPLAGKGAAKKMKENIDASNYVYMSKSPEDATNFIMDTCKESPDTRFTVYGGDGTVFRAVNALMKSGYNDTAQIKVVPVGSGNDFVRSFEGVKGEVQVDVMQFNDKYGINVINMGFDCEVVRRAAKIKKTPLVSGKMAYIFGVVGELMHKKAMDATVTVTYADGTSEVIEDKMLLIAVANANWYGGGFKVAPTALVNDGLIDLYIIKNVSTKTFVSLVGDYKKGEHVDLEKDEVKEKFKDFIFYKKCVGVKVEGCKSVCADGEIFEETEVDIKVIPQAINLYLE